MQASLERRSDSLPQVEAKFINFMKIYFWPGGYSRSLAVEEVSLRKMV
jgi:hypothetical protein